MTLAVWPLIGRDWSRDLETGLWLADSLTGAGMRGHWHTASRYNRGQSNPSPLSQLNTLRWASDCTCHDCISHDVTPASWHVWCEDTCHACHKDAEVFLWSYGSNVTPAPVHFSLNILIQGGSFRFWEFSWFLFKLKHKYMSMYILKRMLPWYAKLIL